MSGCRKGDLALIVKGCDSGKIVTCVELANRQSGHAYGVSLNCGTVWKVDRDLLWIDDYNGKQIHIPFCPDDCMIPIRGLPEESEQDYAETVREDGGH